MEKLTINCVGGIGDILFCEPIFKHYKNKLGYKPFVIIHDHLLWLANYIESAEFIGASVMENTPYHKDQMDMSEFFLPLRYANQVFRNYDRHDHHDLENMMLDKYRLIGLPEDLWKTLEIKILLSKDSLWNRLQISVDTDYFLINENSQVGPTPINISIPENFKKIIMTIEPGFDLLDWLPIMWFANENYHVSTSTFFLFQALKNHDPEWNRPVYIYPRPNEDGLRGISQLKPDFNLILVG